MFHPEKYTFFVASALRPVTDKYESSDYKNNWIYAAKTTVSYNASAFPDNTY